MEWINRLFEQYGYFVLFFGLLSESLATPFPGELAMAYSGYMASLGQFHLIFVILLSFLGTTIGTTITYFIGQKLGIPFFTKYGKYMFLHPGRIEKITSWFEKYGSKILLISYFIPGFRHFTGYVSGIIRIRFRTFLIFNHTGALLWVTTYIMVGRLLGHRFETIIHLITKYSIRAGCIIALGIAAFILVKKYKKQLFVFARANSYVILLALLVMALSLLSLSSP
ncbi:alkaline phosphatase [Paenibacillus baekrokdamisoli]|uniref:Alkaline phosphatase n=1 Tax=Paenibacillus baekrokdamisoli TaxID=1712516 RepID=A0A3G9J105_9BACL|nr:DedA family protein [Paenibacillus baekrokdamisoli]MBB3069549.1 membrane protein DedA with SNARE-associated domain [Paenibacillus baekrokdamisoli]BBH24877.1 alkaline phosphatase [Paenibacillus baekrokdamisoli]